MLEDNDCEITAGFIYIIFNEMYLFYGENYKKIGKTKCIDKRMCGYTTSYIKPLEILYSSELCKNCTLAEKVIFQKLKDYRVVNNREFFNIKLEIAVDIIKLVVIDINNDIIVKYTEDEIKNSKLELKNVNKKYEILKVYLENNKNILNNIIHEDISDICSDENKYNNFVNKLLLNKTKEELKKTMIDKNLILCDKLIFKKINFLFSIEEFLKINRYDIEKINISENDIEILINFLKLNFQNLKSFYKLSDKRIEKKINNNILKLIDNNNIKKFVACIYNLVVNNLFDIKYKQIKKNSVRKMVYAFDFNYF